MSTEGTQHAQNKASRSHKYAAVTKLGGGGQNTSSNVVVLIQREIRKDSITKEVDVNSYLKKM